jgi:hypothetical protein
MIKPPSSFYHIFHSGFQKIYVYMRIAQLRNLLLKFYIRVYSKKGKTT